jgi:hypothetical protein
MNAIHNVFPLLHHFLRRWHIERRIKVRIASHFFSPSTTAATNNEAVVHNADQVGEDAATFLEEWKKVVNAATTTEYQLAWRALKRKFWEHQPLTAYLKNVWLLWKECFIPAWTSRFMHFDAVITSRVKGGHSVLMRCLEVSYCYSMSFFLADISGLYG